MRWLDPNIRAKLTTPAELRSDEVKELLAYARECQEDVASLRSALQAAEVELALMRSAVRKCVVYPDRRTAHCSKMYGPGSGNRPA